MVSADAGDVNHERDVDILIFTFFFFYKMGKDTYDRDQ